MLPVDPTKKQDGQVPPENPATPIQQLTDAVANVRLGNDRPDAPNDRMYKTPDGRYQLPDDRILQELRQFDKFYKPPGQLPPNPK